MPEGMPNGLSLALMARQRRKELKLLFLADPGLADVINIQAMVLPTATPTEGDLLAAVKHRLIAQ